MASTLALLRRLTQANVDYVLIGGMAAIVHGSASVTEDVDVCLRFDLETMTRVLRALEGVEARERMNPARPLIGHEPVRFVGFKNLYLTTTEGVLDLLGEVVGIGAFERVAEGAVSIDLGGFSCRVVGLDDLIACKRALARPKDLTVAAQLEAVKQRRDAKTGLD